MLPRLKGFKRQLRVHHQRRGKEEMLEMGLDLRAGNCGGEGRKEGARQTEGTEDAEAGQGGGCVQRVHTQRSVASTQMQGRDGRGVVVCGVCGGGVMWELRWERWRAHAWERGCGDQGGAGIS